MILPVAVRGLGGYLPSEIVTNDDLAQVLDTSDEWIRTRTGIRQRHIASPEEATSDLAMHAAKAALADAGLGVEDVAAVIVATTTPDHPLPGTAPIVAAKLGTNVGAFDVNAACSGFVYALRVGGALAVTESAPVLVVGAETLSRVTDPEERSTRVLFGDGAGAVVLVPDESAILGPFDLGVDGSDPSMLWTEAGGTRRPTDEQALAERRVYLTMRGGDVYRNAVARMTEASQHVIDAAGIAVGDVDLFVGHQANVRILDAVAKRLGVADSQVHVTVDQHGNTSAASVPLALLDARAAGRLTAGDRVLLAAFGAGLTWAACLLTWSGAAGEASI
ncbi:MAG: beta-ketoacyl-ACP synthase III [Nitriliruptoraceae bacterium]